MSPIAWGAPFSVAAAAAVHRIENLAADEVAAQLDALRGSGA